ncbi:MAG TPA: hypothetical protein VGH28_25580 [Polyangiaceae bacterium]|jgi:hypothetical protein
MPRHDAGKPPNYVVYKRDSVRLHMQFQYEHEMSTMRRRLLVQDPDALRVELRERGVECKDVADTTWNTREFGLCDPDGNALAFYR